MHQGDDELLSDVRKLWTGALVLNRPGRTRDLIGADVVIERLAAPRSVEVMVSVPVSILDALSLRELLRAHIHSHSPLHDAADALEEGHMQR